MTPVIVEPGDGPLILGLPHGGTFVPTDIAARLNQRGAGLDDTDWHIARLYDGLVADVTTVAATFHRYVIDANRDPQGASLYPGQNTTGLCPDTDFDGRPIWCEGQAPTRGDIADRLDRFHRPYHAALEAEIARVKALHGFAILYDCHSIRSTIPFLFDGTLPVFSIGTDDATTCDPALERRVTAICADAEGCDHVVNGRFKGGWTTRHYGRPREGVHAIQMELAQRAYMTETAPWTYGDEPAERLRVHLRAILTALAATPPTEGA